LNHSHNTAEVAIRKVQIIELVAHKRTDTYNVGFITEYLHPGGDAITRRERGVNLV